jgi:competence protein ComEA
MEELPPRFNFDEFLQKYRYHLLVVFLGLILIGGGVLIFKKSFNFSSTKVEILESSGNENGNGEITVEISGAIINPGVFKLQNNARIDDLLIHAGGFSMTADRVWTDKYLNRAAKLSDGQKIYIPTVNEQSNVLSAKNGEGYQNTSSTFSSDSNSMVNINTASLSELDILPGIGPVYGQKIIEHRPYSKPEDIVTSGAITQTLYEKLKNNITVY